MDSKSLMIGDWVSHRGTPRQVVYIYCRPMPDGKDPANEIGFTHDEDEWINADNVEPIPLTKEILDESFTWNDLGRYDVVGRGNVLRGGYLILRRDGVVECTLYSNKANMSINVQYVHELQMALRCCGLSELAYNFKL